jgi:hypothetical protein
LGDCPIVCEEERNESSADTLESDDQFRTRIAEFDGGELTDVPSAHPYSIVFPRAHNRAVVYSTKNDAAFRLLASEDNELSVGVIARYGLPNINDYSGIANIVRDFDVCFLGDCDPYDLIVFFQLRQHLAIRFLGTSDALVSALGVDVNEQITIAFSAEEVLAMSLVREVWPDYSTSLGPDCARLLECNRKLELEAVVSFQTKPVANLLNLIQSPA